MRLFNKKDWLTALPYFQPVLCMLSTAEDQHADPEEGHQHGELAGHGSYLARFVSSRLLYRD